MITAELRQLSGSLIPQYRQMHREKKYRGGSTLRHYVADIAKIVAEIETHTILDYGSGKGAQYHEDGLHKAWGGIMPTLFDPAVSRIDELPEGRFDGVICTGVLEHIPRRRGELAQAIANLRHYAKRWCFIVVGTELAHKKLPDGRNAHVTIKPREWWQEELEAAFADGARLYLRFVP